MGEARFSLLLRGGQFFKINFLRWAHRWTNFSVIYIPNQVDICPLDPPTNPSPPTSPFVSTVTTHNLTLHWTPPTFHGNLPLTGYVVELRLLGNPLCLQMEPEWDEHQTAQDSSAVELVVSDLVPYQQYQVRIRATNSAYQSEPSSETEPIWTQSDGQCYMYCKHKISWRHHSNRNGLKQPFDTEFNS